MPGSGRQSRAVGAQGKIESKGAVGSCAASTSDAWGLRVPLDLEVPDVERVEGPAVDGGASSSWVPTMGIAASSLGCLVPSKSAGRSPSPTSGRSAGSLPSMKNWTARAFGLPAIILFFSRA